jgi:Zn-dependent protease with chaperone function
MFKEIQGAAFAHPLDTAITSSLATVPILSKLARKVLQNVENSYELINLSSAVAVGPSQLADLHRILVTTARLIGIDDVPELFVRQNPLPNAYTLAFQGRKPFIVIHSSLLDIVDEKEIAAVLAHEMGHIKCEHSLWITVMNLLLLGASGVGPFSMPLQSFLTRWLQSAELSCDRAALLATGDSSVVVSVMMKLSGGSPTTSKHLNVDAYIEQAKRYKRESEKATRSSRRAPQLSSATHPMPVVRALEIIDWEKSAQYKGLLRRAQARA